MLCLTVFQKAFLRQQWNDWIQKDKALVVNEIYIRATQTPHEHHWKWTCLFVSIVGGETFLATRSCTVTIQIVYYLTFTVFCFEGPETGYRLTIPSETYTLI